RDMKRSEGKRPPRGRPRASGPGPRDRRPADRAASPRRPRSDTREAALAEIATDLVGQDDLAQPFSSIGRRICRLLGTDGAALFLVEGDALVRRGSYGLDGVAAPGIPRWEVGERAAARALMAGPGGPRGILEAPILLRGAVVGVPAVFQQRRRVFSRRDVALPSALARHVPGALDPAELVRALQARLRETETLLAVSQAVSTTLDLTETLRRIARETGRTLGADTVGACLADPGGEYLRPVAGFHVPRDLIADSPAFAVPLR